MVDFAGANSPDYRPAQVFSGRVRRAPAIGHDVWIGQDVLLAQGISVGHGSVIASGAVVTKDVPPYSIVGGTPARMLRPRFPTDLIERFLAVEWWNYAFTDIGHLGVTQPESFLEEVQDAVGRGIINNYAPSTISPSLFVAGQGALPQ
ncbi:CatB-related O-acetyltransferase [Roseomonas sp. WA12]